MKKFFIITLAFIMLLSLAACGGTETETKYLVTEVIHEMAPDYVLKYVNHYDENWVQTGRTTYLNGELNQELTYELDPEHDQILKAIMTAPDGATAVIEYKNTYDEAGHLILQEQYAEGVLTLRTEFTYDENGNRLTQTQDNTAGSTTSLTFDENGNILTMTSTIEGNEMRPGSTTKVTYTYDEYGNRIESVQTGQTDDPNAVPGQGRTVSEVENGKIVKTTAYDVDGNVTEIREFTYDGNVETELVYDEAGNLVLTGTRTYDDVGNLLVSESTSGNSTSRSTYTYQKVEVPVK